MIYTNVQHVLKSSFYHSRRIFDIIESSLYWVSAKDANFLDRSLETYGA